MTKVELEAETNGTKCLCVNMHPACHTLYTLFPFFQPTSAKLNSAFLLSVNNIGDHRQLVWLAAAVW